MTLGRTIALLVAGWLAVMFAVLVARFAVFAISADDLCGWLAVFIVAGVGGSAFGRYVVGPAAVALEKAIDERWRR